MNKPDYQRTSRRFNLREDNYRFLESISDQESLSISAFLNELLENMAALPTPVGGWLGESLLRQPIRPTLA